MNIGDDLRHQFVRLSYSPEITSMEFTREEMTTIYDYIKGEEQEIERLKNNWNELRKWIVNNKHNENTEERYLVVDYGTLLGKMSELKGDDKE